ncbi:TrbI/VirB10 family protein [Sphingomonas turrisvirgatae]|uniref:Conjugal transfer protein TraI n=1 Tax=Sphingomonas turrisvirgatae TaxID=1888892 RepID=A0A1E3LSX5_9SPHN|nr:TrbI/VirB10 family protein [Sphingomonas turrisvirgatae]ODP36804.1 conjugal transfer protein TraI [Sphingomonas turrisvirgatae]
MTGPVPEQTPDDPPRPEREIAAELRLRPDRPKVVRLSRKVLGLIAGVSAVAIGGSLIWALQSSRPTTTAELYNTDNRTTADGLSRLPTSYAGVPREVPPLGPPLPGDLGRPMLNNGIQPGPIPGAPAPATAPDPEAQRVAQERQRIAQEREAARASRLFAGESRTPGSGPSAAGLEMPGAASPQFGALAAGSGQPTPPPSEGDRRSAFLGGPADRRTISTETLQAPASPYTVQAGAVIAAAMVTGLRSDLPGQITAQVTENVYDGPTGRILLIPQGARLIGQYDAQVSFGQSRALLVWSRLILPNGRSIILERQPGADASGYAGLEDKVDNHWGQLFRAAMLSTLLSVGSEAGTSSDESDLLQAIRRGGSDSISQTGRQIVGRSLSIQPTITIRPGFPVRVIVTRDLVLEPYRG